MGIYALDIVLAIVIKNVGIVFGYVGALVLSNMFFILPGGFCLCANMKEEEQSTMWRKVVSAIYVMVGIVVMVGGFMGTTYSIINGGGGGH